jgi:hypothetical protein
MWQELTGRRRAPSGHWKAAEKRLRPSCLPRLVLWSEHVAGVDGTKAGPQRTLEGGGKATPPTLSGYRLVLWSEHVTGVDGTQAGPQRTLEGGGKTRGEHHHPVYSVKNKEVAVSLSLFLFHIWKKQIDKVGRVMTPSTPLAQQRQVEIIWMSKLPPSSPLG